MEDYPRDLAEFERRFATEEACRAYLEQLRWPEGFRCPRCGAPKAWPVRRRWWQCAACAHQTSVTAGTIFQDTRTPLVTWFRAMWWVTNQKTGVSALGLQRTLGLRSYKTAWTWLHKLRRAMVRPGRDCLTGWVEVDETYVAGVHPGRRGRQTETKALVVVAVEVERGRLGRIRLRRLLDASGPSLTAFVQDAGCWAPITARSASWRIIRGISRSSSGDSRPKRPVARIWSSSGGRRGFGARAVGRRRRGPCDDGGGSARPAPTRRR